MFRVPRCTEQTPGAEEERTYDAYGRVLGARIHWLLENKISTWTFAYDGRGRLLTEEANFTGPQPLHSRQHHEYEPDRRVRSWEDRDLDGKEETVWTYGYADDGKLLRTTTHEPKNPSTGSDVRFS